MLGRGLVALGLLLLSALAGACAAAADQNEFAIYLLKQDMTGGEAQKQPLDSLALGDKIISSGDIVSYSQATHQIELTPEAYARVRSLFKVPVRVAGVPFVVAVGSQRIYAGAFWTPLSSLMFDGAFIMQPFEEKGNAIRIDLGYPGGASYTRDDPRSDPRIFDSLAKAGKLKPGQPHYRLRIRNSGSVPIKSLTVVMPEDRIEYGDVEPGATTDYRDVPHGVFAYSAYQYLAGDKLVMQPVVDWVGEKPLVGEDFTCVIDLDPSRAPAPQIRLDSVERDK